MKKYLLVAFILTISLKGIAQPTITNIDPVSTYPGGEVVISGSGFGTNVADIVVWFGGVQSPNIISANNTSVVAEVPPAAPNAPIIVSRVSTGLRAESRKLFFISYSGENFTQTDLEPEITLLNNTIEKFEICGCDFDGDGKVDLATSQESGTSINLLLNTSTFGNITFSTSTFSVSTPTISIDCGDMDGDGKPDLIMSRSGANRNQLYIYPNTSTTGNITFGGQILVNLLTNNPTTSPYQAVKVSHGDINGDGKPDIVVSNGNFNETLINIVENTSTIGSISFATPTIYELASQDASGGISIRDLDNDGLLDLVLTRNNASNLFVYRNLGGGGFNFESPLQLSTGGETAVNVSAIDLNGDGLKELIVTETLKSAILIYENTSSAGSISYNDAVSFSVGTGAQPNSGPWVAKGADFDGDGQVDLVVANRGEASYSVLINQGSLNFAAIDKSTSYANRNLYTGDLDGDAKPDIAFTSLEIPTGNFSLQFIRNANCFQPTILNEQPLAICSGQTLTLEAQESPGTTYSWKKDGGDLGLNTSSIDITTFGTYEVTAVSESGACTKTATINVADGSGTVPANPVASNDGPSCEGETVNLNVNSQSGATYSWVGPNGFTSTDQNPVLSNVNVNNAGIYEVTVKIGDCLSSTATTEVSINSVPSFSLAATSGSTTVCQGNTVTLETQNRSGYTYSWLKDGSSVAGSTATFGATSSGTYQASITENSTGCIILSNEVDVLVLSTPSSDYSVSTPICTGIDATFTNTSSVDANATVVYTWDFGDGTSINTTNATHVYTTAGDYDVTLNIDYTGISGCSNSTSKSVTVVDAVPVNIQSSTDVLCEGETVDLTVSNNFSSIVWSTTETSDAITVDAAGTYDVTTVDANDCQSTDNITISAGEVPTILAFANQTQGSITVPSGTDVQMEATGADSYLWEPSDFLSDPNISNPISTPNAEITYTVSGAVTDGCIGSATITILVEQVAEEIDVEPISAFNPDNTNDPTWRILRSENYPQCTLSIFDERGSLVFRETGYSNDWDGTYEGNKLPEGVYYFVFGCPAVKPYTGTVLLVR